MLDWVEKGDWVAQAAQPVMGELVELVGRLNHSE